MNKNSHPGYRYPAEVIGHAIWLYFRFTLSYREVERPDEVTSGIWMKFISASMANATSYGGRSIRMATC